METLEKDLAQEVYKTKLANDVASQKSLRQSQLDRVLARQSKKAPVKEMLEMTEYASLERDMLKAKKNNDAELENELYHKMRALETIEMLVRTPNDLAWVTTQATYETVYNGQPKHKKVKFQVLRPLWLGWRQRIEFKNEINCGFNSVEETDNALKHISKVLVEDILTQVRKYKDNSPVGHQYYDTKKEKKIFASSPVPYRTWLHKSYNNNGVDYFPAKVDLIKNLAEGNFDDAFDGIDYVSLTESERKEILKQLKPVKAAAKSSAPVVTDNQPTQTESERKS